MKKKLVAMLLTAAMAASMATGMTAFAADDKAETTEAAEETKEEDKEEAKEEDKDADKEDADKADAAAEEVDFGVEPQFDPNPDYDKYTVVEYTIEALNADIVATVSAKEDDSEFEIQCNFYGEDQLAVATYDGKEVKVTKDQTGFMEGDTPAIIELALKNDKWAAIGEADAEGDKADAAMLEPEFDPNPDYDKYTVVEYTIESLNADIVATVSAKEDDSEFEIQCNFYGEDQLAVATYDGKEVKVTKDQTGFMEGDSPAIIEKALEQDNWEEIK